MIFGKSIKAGCATVFIDVRPDIEIEGIDLHLYEGSYRKITVKGGARLFIHDGIKVKVDEVVVSDGALHESTGRVISRKAAP